MEQDFRLLVCFVKSAIPRDRNRNFSSESCWQVSCAACAVCVVPWQSACSTIMKRAYYAVKSREKRIFCVEVMEHVKHVVHTDLPGDKATSCSRSASPAGKEPRGLGCPDPKTSKRGKFPALLMDFQPKSRKSISEYGNERDSSKNHFRPKMIN